MKFLTVEEMSEFLGLNPQVVERLAQRGQIPSMNIGRILQFPYNDIVKLIQSAEED